MHRNGLSPRCVATSARQGPDMKKHHTWLRRLEKQFRSYAERFGQECDESFVKMFGKKALDILHGLSSGDVGRILLGFIVGILSGPLVITVVIVNVLSRLLSVLSARSIKAVSVKNPKKIALLLLEFLCRPADREGCIGDLLEATAAVQQVHGKKAADAYFWWQASRTALNLMLGQVKKLRWIALILAALGWIERQLSR